MLKRYAHISYTERHISVVLQVPHRYASSFSVTLVGTIRNIKVKASRILDKQFYFSKIK